MNSLPRARAAGLILAAAILAACSSKTGNAAKAPPADSTSDPRQRPIALSPDQREHLKIVVAAAETYRPTVLANGTVAFDGNLSTQVLSPVSGPVIRILVEPGVHVAKGAVLAYVSSPDYATAVAAYKKAAAAAEQTKRIAALNEELFKADGIARRDLEQSQVDATSAAADRDAALQQLRALGLDSASIDAIKGGAATVSPLAAVRAPLEGTVVEKLINPGQLLAGGTTPAFTVADLSRMWVIANVFESDLPYVSAGDHAVVTGAAISKPINGVTDYLAALVDPNTRATSARIEVPNPGRVLKNNMYVQVAIQSSKTVHGLLIPVSSVLRDEDNLPFVFVEQGAGAFARRHVTLGNRVGSDYEVRDGLKEGEKLIAEGGLFLEFAQSQ